MLLPEALQLLDLSLFDQLADLLGGALPDPLDLLQLARRQPPQIAGLRRDGLGRALVGADPKGLRVPLLQHRELRELPQHVEHVLLAVRHAEVLARTAARTGAFRPGAACGHFLELAARLLRRLAGACASSRTSAVARAARVAAGPPSM